MIVNGRNKYVTEMSEETQEDHIDHIGERTGKFVAKARPKQTPSPTSSSPTITLPYHITCVSGSTSNQVSTTKSWFEVSKKMSRLLRHDPSVLREEDGAVEFRILASMFRSEFTSSQCWSLRTWLNCLQKGGGPKKRFQYCVDPYLRAMQGHSGGKHINPT